MKFLGKTVVVQHCGELDEKKFSSIILPSTVDKPATRVVKAKVKFLGKKSKWCGHIAIDQIVLVPQHFGTRIKDDLIIYDDEDVLAVILE